ncbi:MAG: GAF domain-containing protein [Anaerolineae bacterium]|jgi:signal transduction histidine kinase
MENHNRTKDQLTQDIAELRQRVDDLEGILAAREREDQALREVCRAIASEAELEKLLTLIVSRTTELLGASSGGIYLHRPDQDVLECTIAAGSHPLSVGSIFRRGEGVVGTVWETGQSLVVEDSHDLEQRPFAREDVQWRSFAAAPLRHGRDLLGVLAVRSPRPGSIAEADLESLDLFAAQAALAIEMARLCRLDRGQRELAEAVAEAATVVGSTLDLDQVLDRILAQVERVIDGDAFNVMLIQQDQARIVRWRGYGQLGVASLVANLRLPVGQYPTLLQMIRTGEPLLISDTLTFDGWVSREGWEWQRSYLSVPIRISDLVVGFLNVDGRRPGQFDTTDARRLEAFATHAAVAIENAQLYREMRLRLAEASILRQMMVAAASTLESERVIERTFRTLRAVRGVEFIGLALPNEERAALRYHSSCVGRPVAVEESLLPLDASAAGRVYRTGEAILVDDVQASPYSHGGVGAIQSQIAIPVRIGTRTIGVLMVESVRRDAFDEEDLAFYTAIAGQLAVALENARLYEAVRRQADELGATVARLQELDRLKSEFIQNVSHELRMPLALIRGHAELLDGGEMGELAPDQRKPVEVIARRSRMLSELVEDITLILGAEERAVEPWPVALDELTRAAVQDFQLAAEQAGLRLEVDIAPNLPLVTGAPVYVRRVLDNLLSNAVKFTETGGLISVNVFQADKEVVVEVSDTGIGIPPQEQERIFTRFYQVDSSARRKRGGVGLGLALVREVLALFDGQVTVESQIGQGSTFTVTLPVFQQ